MTRLLNETNGLDSSDLKVLSDIQTTGWHITGVFPRTEGKVNWAFSVGLFHTFHHPEVILLGLRLKSCVSILSGIGEQIQAGIQYDSEQEFAEILVEPYLCVFRQVHQNHYPEYVGYALWFYQDDAFPLLQCFWPDRDGKYPWEDGCDESVASLQPLLYLP